MSILTDVRDHLKNVIVALDAQKAEAQAKVDAIEAELAKPVPAPTLDDLKAMIAKL